MAIFIWDDPIPCRSQLTPGRVEDGGTCAPAMSLRLPPYVPLPSPQPDQPQLRVPIHDLRPTQMCVGMAEVRSRQRDFTTETSQERLSYLSGKPVPRVSNAAGRLWMVDRHHRLRALLELDPMAVACGYEVLRMDVEDDSSVLAELKRRGWLYLHDGRGHGPHPPSALPSQLSGLQDDPYRSLVWKLKKEGRIRPAPLTPFHEFRWAAWLRRRSLPPFSSMRLEPALPAARALVRSRAASHLAGWKGPA